MPDRIVPVNLLGIIRIASRPIGFMEHLELTAVDLKHTFRPDEFDAMTQITEAWPVVAVAQRVVHHVATAIEHRLQRVRRVAGILKNVDSAAARNGLDRRSERPRRDIEKMDAPCHGHTAGVVEEEVEPEVKSGRIEAPFQPLPVIW